MKYVKYAQPLPGKSAEGHEFVGTEIIFVPIADAIGFMRKMHIDKHGVCNFRDEELLDDFVIINWGEIVEINLA